MLQELRRRISAAIFGWEHPLLTFIYPGFHCASNQNLQALCVRRCLMLKAASRYGELTLQATSRIQNPPKKRPCNNPSDYKYAVPTFCAPWLAQS